MASIRKRGKKWQVQIRRKNCPPVTRSFINRRDAKVWARQNESQIDRTGLPQNTKSLETHTLADLVSRYRDTELARKRSGDRELDFLTACGSFPTD